MADETTRVDAWLYTTLTAAVPLAGGWHSEHAPRGTASPFGVFAMISARDVQTHSADRMMVDALYTVRVISETESFVDLQDAADAIDTALHQSDGTAGGASVMSTTREEIIRRVEIDDGREHRSLGAYFRVLVQLP